MKIADQQTSRPADQRKLFPYLARLVLITLISACSVGAPYQQPKTPAPQGWANIQAGQNWPDKNWWQQFNSPELTQLMTTAIQNNYDLKAAVARIHQADAQLKIAGATLLPTLDAGGSATRSQSPKQTGTTNGVGYSTGGKPVNLVSAQLSASYEIDFWGKNRAQVASAQALANASRYDKEVVMLTVTTGVANTYFDLLATQARIDIANQNLAAAQHLLDALKKQFAQGTVSGLTVAQEENLVAQQQVTIPPLLLEAQQDKNALAVLVGTLPEGFNITATGANFPQLAVPDITPGLPSGLLRRRPDVAESEADLISAHENITVARAAFFPDITLTAEGGYESSVLKNLFSSGSKFFDLGASATQPIFHGGALSGELELSKAQYDEQLQDYRKAVISAFSDVENALSAAQQNAALMQGQIANTQSAQKAYDLTQRQFQQGVVDITAVLNTERSLYTAEDSTAQAQLARLESAVSLYSALGGGWQRTP